MIIDHECKILSVDAADMPNLTEQDLRTISNYKLFGYELKVNSTPLRRPGRPRKNPDAIIENCSLANSVADNIKPVRVQKHTAEYWAAKAAERQNSPYTKEAVSEFFSKHPGGDYDKARELYESVKAEPSAHINKDGSIKPKGHAVALRFVKKQYPDVYKEMEDAK